MFVLACGVSALAVQRIPNKAVVLSDSPLMLLGVSDFATARLA